MSERCSKRIPVGTWGRSRQCERNGVVNHRGELFCAIHNPVAVAQRKQARAAKLEALLTANRNHHAKGALADQLAEAVLKYEAAMEGDAGSWNHIVALARTCKQLSQKGD